MLESLYRGLTRIAEPLVRHWLDRRAAIGKEDPVRREERFGRAACPRPAGRLVWIHAASVGESLAALPLLNQLLDRDPGLHALMTTGTVTSAALMAQRLPPRAIHQYVPVDLPSAVTAFMEHWRPDLILWMESEFWPNLLGEIRRRNIPCALINARLSMKSFRGWSRMPGTAARLLSAFRTALAQTEEEARRLRVLGIHDARAVGNLKYSAPPLPVDLAELSRLRDAVGTRRLWLFASTHPGEEALAASVHAALRRTFPDLLTLLVPRHPDRGPEVERLLTTAHGLRVTRRTAGGMPRPDTDLYLGDTLGELGLFFRLAPATVIGGSFVAVGGHNPIEPALLESAVLYGPEMFNFAEVAAEMEQAGGAVRLPDTGALVAELTRLLRDDAVRATRIEAARAVAERNRQAVDRVMADLLPLLDEAGIGREAA